MTSQQAVPAKLSGGQQIQILPANMQRTIQLLNPSLAMQTSGGAIVAEQSGRCQSGVSIVSVAADASKSSAAPPVWQAVRSQNSYIQVQVAQASRIAGLPKLDTERTIESISAGDLEKLKHNPARSPNAIGALLKKPEQSSNSLLKGKLHDGQLQLSGGQIVHIPGANGGNPIQVQVSSAASNAAPVRTAQKPVHPVLYIQTPPTLKSAGDNAGNAPPMHSQIILRRPQTASIQLNGRQLVNVSNKATACGKPPLAPKLGSQSILIQKPGKVTPVPLSLSATFAGKNSVTYVNSAKRPNPPPNREGQPSASASASASNATVPTSSNQKLVLATMKMPNAKIYVPMTGQLSLPPKGGVINFQIGNGQIKGDPQGNITVMGDFNSSSGTAKDVPPLHPLSKSATSSSAAIQKSGSGDGAPSASRIPKAEPIGEREYSLSIPETEESTNDGGDLFTVTLLEGNEASAAAAAAAAAEKSKSLPSNKNNPSSESQGSNPSASHGPAILRRSNSDSNEKKANNARRRISLCADPANDGVDSKVDAAKGKPVAENSEPDATGTTDVDDRAKVSSLLCREELDADIDSKPTNRQAVGQPNRDRRKSRIHSDMRHSFEKNYTKIDESSSAKYDKIPNRRTEDKNDAVVAEDAPGLNWKNGVALLNGSSLQFQMNEFGVIDVLEENSSKNKSQSIKRQTLNGRGKKSASPDDFYCCDECGCHGMPSEFVTSNFCSKACQLNFEKNSRQKKEKQLLNDKKRKQKKFLTLKDTDRELLESEDAFDIGERAYDARELNIKLVPKKSIPPRPEERDAPESGSEGTVPNKRPPWLHAKSGFSWSKYLEYCKAEAAPAKLFREPLPKNNFKPGMKVEAIDPVHPSIFAICTITQIQGHRLRLHFDGYHEDFDFWVNAESYDIFPPGWCEKNKRTLRLPKGFDQNSFSWPLYLKQTKAIAAPANLFSHVSETHCSNGFRVNMKLEAEDRKNSLTCVASVVDVINNRILVHFDSWDDIYDYWVDPTSPYIHPVGWCDENGYSLTPPHSIKDPENFTWEQYLADTNTIAAPARAFKTRPPHKFKVGMKLEAVDKRASFLIRVATVTDVRKYQIRISFDGWPDELSYWVDDDSPDIHYVGWCFKTGHLLEPPLTEEDLKKTAECGTIGCQGFGNLCSAKLTAHSTLSECPYRLPVVSPVFRDRLDGTRPPPQLSEPRPREPRKISAKSKMERAEITENMQDEECLSYISASKRSFTDAIKTEVVSEEESACPLKKKCDVLPLSKEQIKSSVIQPGYLPNPNRLGPIGNSEFFPLNDILQRESLRVDPRNWNQPEVQRFIQNVLNCGEFSWKLSKHRIDGEALLMLSQEDLVNVIGMKLGPAIKVYNSIVQLRQKILS